MLRIEFKHADFVPLGAAPLIKDLHLQENEGDIAHDLAENPQIWPVLDYEVLA